MCYRKTILDENSKVLWLCNIKKNQVFKILWENSNSFKPQVHATKDYCSSPQIIIILHMCLIDFVLILMWVSIFSQIRLYYCTYRTYYIHTGPSKMINNEELFPKKSNCCWRRYVCAAATKWLWMTRGKGGTHPFCRRFTKERNNDSNNDINCCYCTLGKTFF